MNRRSIADRVALLLEDILLSSMVGSSDVMRADQNAAFAAHSSLWSCDFHFIDGLADEMGGEDTYLFDAPTEQIAAVDGLPDIALVVDKGDHWLFTRVCPVDRRELRGVTRILPKLCLAISHTRMSKNRVSDPDVTFVGLVGDTWVDIGSRTVNAKGNKIYKVVPDHDLGVEIDNTVKMSCAAALTSRYDWHAAFGFNSAGPRILLPTNPRGGLALFRTRELEEGRTRRAALKHWVSSHYRQAGEQDLAYVRKHLRGSSGHFVWEDMLCELMPSEFDIEKNEFLRQEAAEWRAKRQHNRFRVRVKRQRKLEVA